MHQFVRRSEKIGIVDRTGIGLFNYSKLIVRKISTVISAVLS